VQTFVLRFRTKGSQDQWQYVGRRLPTFQRAKARILTEDQARVGIKMLCNSGYEVEVQNP
jgi:hypothetical protein